MTISIKASVTNLITEAVNAATSAYSSARDAGVEAAKQSVATDDLKTNLDNIMSAYATALNQNHNVKAWFKDALTLSLAADTAISYEKSKTVDGEKVKEEVHTTAIEAASKSKNEMREAAKALRDDLGMGRKTGGGRGAKQPAAKAQTKTAAETVTNSFLVRSAVYEQLEEILKEPKLFEEFKLFLKDHGVTGLRRK